ncbi:MAG: hypothetical protein E6Q76_14510 [Rhizobium sp.]|nr:MAG: hypothetical protein E6Q76_14510 [Rhizobium sp.]
MVPLELNKPNKIEGGLCVILNDEVGPESSHEDPVTAVKEAPDHKTIWVRESLIRQINAEYPDMKMFGLWQILLFNKIVDPAVINSGLIIIDGLDAAVYIEGGVALQTGYVAANQTTFPCPFSVAEALHIPIPPGLLKRPANEVLHPVEAARRHSKREARNRFIAMLATAPVVIGAVIVDQRLAANARERQSQIDALNVQTQSSAEDLKALQISRAPPPVPRNQAALDILMQIVRATDGFELKNALFSSPQWEGTANAIDRAKLPKKVQVLEQQQGNFLLRWTVE